MHRIRTVPQSTVSNLPLLRVLLEAGTTSMKTMTAVIILQLNNFLFLNSYRTAATSNINLPLMPFTLAKLSRLSAECNGTFLHIGVPGRMQVMLSSALE